MEQFERDEPIEVTQLVGRILYETLLNINVNCLEFLLGDDFNFEKTHDLNNNEYPKLFIDYEGEVGDTKLLVTYVIFYGEKVSKRILVKEKEGSKIFFEYNL